MQPQGNQPRAPPRQQQWGGALSQMLRMVLTYFAISSYFSAPRSSIESSKQSSIAGDDLPSSAFEQPSQYQTMMMGVHPDSRLPVFPVVDENGKKIGPHKCVYPKTAFFNFDLYLTDNYMFDPESDRSNLILREKHISYDSTVPLRVAKDINITVSDHMYNNGSVYAHAFFTNEASLSDGDYSDYSQDDVIYQRFALVRHRKKVVPKKTYKLLERRDVSVADEAVALTQTEPALGGGEGDMVPYWVPQLDVALVVDMPQAFGRNGIPSAILQHLKFDSVGNYYPIVYHNDFFMTSNALIELNASTVEVPLAISLSHMSFWRWHMQSQMEQQWRMQQSMGTGSEKDTDLIREVLFDTNPILLGVTFFVSMLHMLFDFLAFKNDVQVPAVIVHVLLLLAAAIMTYCVQFWRKKKSMAGMSVQSLGVNCFFQTVIFLYLMDNDTSWMILFSSGIGLCIEYWKLAKAFNVSIGHLNPTSEGSESPAGTVTEGTVPAPPLTGEAGQVVAVGELPSNKTTKILGINLPFAVSWKLSDSYTSSKTREYDAIATSHLLYIVIPLVFGYSIYSLIYISHKSFYSWLLGSLVGFVYAFGFVLMTPQLFINYKLKSVAHMPWKAMVYKSLNTFIDDLFAFIIKMPLLHRLACFRDDIIFFIYLYQRWVYSVDMSRVNEFGQGGEDGTSGEEEHHRVPSMDQQSEVTPNPPSAEHVG